MRSLILLFILEMFGNHAKAQGMNRKYFEGEWKCYEQDSVSFTILSIDFKKGGFKAKGQTFDGIDSIFADTKTEINRWELNTDTLYAFGTFFSKEKKVCQIHILHTDENIFTCLLRDLRFAPALINEKEFTFRSASTLHMTGAQKTVCIYDLMYFHMDTIGTTVLVHKDAVDNIIPYLINCKNGFKFIQSYKEDAWIIQLPLWLDKMQGGMGDYNHTITFNNRTPDDSAIDIYYDYNGSQKKYFFENEGEGKTQITRDTIDGKVLCKFINWNKQIAGKIFFENNVSVTYYTSDHTFEQELIDAILSFKFE